LRTVSEILECFSVETPASTLQQRAQQTGLPNSTGQHRPAPASTGQHLAHSTVREGFRDRDGDRYSIGMHLVQWSTPGTCWLDILRLVRPILQ